VGLYRWPIKEERKKKGETAKKRVWLRVSVAIFLFPFLQFVRSGEKNQYTERKKKKEKK
jgi:hypothetical protein